MSIPHRVTSAGVEGPRWDRQACEGMGARSALGPQHILWVKGSHACMRASSRVGKRVHVHVFVYKLVRRALRRGSVLGGGRNQGAERLPCSRRGAWRSDLSNKLVLVFLVWLLGKESQTRQRNGFCRARPSPLLRPPRALTCGQVGGQAATLLGGGRASCRLLCEPERAARPGSDLACGPERISEGPAS